MWQTSALRSSFSALRSPVRKALICFAQAVDRNRLQLRHEADAGLFLPKVFDVLELRRCDGTATCRSGTLQCPAAS